MSVLIELKKASKRFGNVVAVDSIDVSVRAGQVYGFLGPNGAGKTTTISMLMGLVKPTGGRVLVLGNDPFVEARQINCQIGYVSGDVQLYPNYTPIEYLRLCASISKAKFSQLDDLAARLQIEAKRKIGQLSKGNKQKVLLAQAFIGSPDLLIMDEPTSGLDPLLQATFFEMIDEYKENGGTVFLSSHILSEVERLCDRVAIIRRGKIVEEDAVENLLSTKYRRVELRAGKADRDRIVKSIPDIKQIHSSEDSVSFGFSGDLNELLKVLSQSELDDLRIRRADLDEIFMHYYRESDDE